MSKMNAPKMEVVRFKEADVIVASGANMTMVVGGFNDTTSKNGTINISGFSYTNDGNQTRTHLYSVLSDFYGVDIDGYTKIAKSSNSITNFGTLLNSDENGSSKNYDGTYSWDSINTRFTKQ